MFKTSRWYLFQVPVLTFQQRRAGGSTTDSNLYIAVRDVRHDDSAVCSRLLNSRSELCLLNSATKCQVYCLHQPSVPTWSLSLLKTGL